MDDFEKVWDYLFRKKPVLSLLLGVVLLFLFLGGLSTGFASCDWPTTQGVISSSEYIRGKFYDEEEVSYTAWFARVSYRYSVNGREYYSDDVRLGDGGQTGFSRSTDHFAKEVVKRYPVGKQVEVFYDLDNPGFAVLEPGLSFGSLMFGVIGTGLGFLFLFVGLFGILIAGTRKSRCPHCKKLFAGKTIMEVTVQADEVRYYTCECKHCGHQWQVIKEIADGIGWE